MTNPEQMPPVEKKKAYVLQTCMDGKTWEDTFQFDDENEAIKKKREMDHQGPAGVEFRIIPKE